MALAIGACIGIVAVARVAVAMRMGTPSRVQVSSLSRTNHVGTVTTSVPTETSTPQATGDLTLQGTYFGVEHFALYTGRCPFLDHHIVGTFQRQGIGTQLVRIAAENAERAGCEWLHVDFDDELADFYIDACGFRTTNAGLILLRR